MKKQRIFKIDLSKIGNKNYEQCEQAMYLFSNFVKLGLFKNQKQLNEAIDSFADSCEVYNLYKKGKNR